MHMKRVATLFLVTVFILSCFVGCTDKNAVDKAENIALDEGRAFTDKAATDWQICAESGDLKLSFMPYTTHLKLENTKDGGVWYSNPQAPEEDTYASKLTQMRMMSTVVIEYANTDSKKRTSLNLYTSSVKSKKYDIYILDNGVRFDYNVSEVGGTVTLCASLENGELITKTYFKKTDTDKENIIISAISPLEFFVSGKVGESGYLFLPDGSGALLDYEISASSVGEYSRPIFGEEPTNITADYYLECDKQSVYLPVYGAVRGESALLAIAEVGAEYGTLMANSCGAKTSFANAYVSYGFADSVEYKVGNYSTELFDKSGYYNEPVTTRYMILSGENANYSGMARAYRSYLTEKYGITLEKTKSGFYADVYGAVVKRASTLGIPHDRIVSLTSADDLADMTEYLGENGIDDLTVRYRSWNKDELKGRKINGISSFGGGSLKKLSKLDGVRVYPAILDMQTYSSAGFLDRMLNASSSITGLTFSWHGYSYSTLNETGDTEYRLRLPKLQANTEKLLEKFENFGAANLAFSDIANLLYCDFGGEGYRRSEALKIFEALIKKASEQTDSLLLDSPNSYAAAYADVIYNAPIDHSNHDILGRSVPFYTMVMSGIAECVAPSFNSNNIGDDVMLYSVASGASPCYSWIKSPASELIGTSLSSLSDVNFDSTKAQAVAEYKKLSEIFEKTDGSLIYSHEYIDGMSITRYENGVSVYVNFSDKELYTENGIPVEAGSFAAQEVRGG